MRLAAHYPELLTLEEQVLWKLIQDCPLLWKDVTPGPNWWQLTPRGEPLRLPFDIPLLLRAWETLKRVAAGEEEDSALAPFIQPDLAGQPFAPPPLRHARRRTATGGASHE